MRDHGSQAGEVKQRHIKGGAFGRDPLARHREVAGNGGKYKKITLSAGASGTESIQPDAPGQVSRDSDNSQEKKQRLGQVRNIGKSPVRLDRAVEQRDEQPDGRHDHPDSGVAGHTYGNDYGVPAQNEPGMIPSHQEGQAEN